MESKPENTTKADKQEEDAKSDRSDNIWGLVELMTDTNYKRTEFEHNGFKQEVFALQSASTDYDLTGQVIWQAANIMSTWMVEKFMPELKDKRILELGAGPGLCGFVAAHEAKQVVFTDYIDLVMDLIDKNMQECNPRPNSCSMYAAQLDWDKMVNPEFYDLLEYTNKEQTVEGKFKDLVFDYVIGSDVVYWP